MQAQGVQFPRMTVAEVAKHVGGEGRGDESLAIVGLGTIEAAGADDLVFVNSERYASLWGATAAKVALVTRKVAHRLPERGGTALVFVEDADVAFATLMKLAGVPPPDAGLPASGIHPSAVVDATAKLGDGVRIGAHCVVGPRANIGSGSILYPGAAVFDDARVGADCILWNGTIIRERCVLGDRCILNANVVIGADGFGFRPAPDGKGVVKIPHAGRVEIGNDVEIGANTCVDRGKLSATVIGDFCKIDNLCQIGHNSHLGCGVIIAGKVGISGSVVIGDGVMIGGGAGVADHVTIGSGAVIAAAAGVMRDVPPRGRVSGIPARDIKQFFREQAALARLPDMVRPPRVAAAGQDPAIAPPVRRTFQEWLDALNSRAAHKIVIRDCDGPDRGHPGALMTEREFQQKLGRCTFNIRV